MDNKELSGVEFAFGPAWARQAPEKLIISETSKKQHPKSKKNWQTGRGNNHDSKRFGNLNRREKGAGKFESRKKSFSPAASDKTDTRHPAPVVLSVITVSFIPERRGLKPLVKQLSSTRLAYSLFEIAATCLSKPEFYATVLESVGKKDRPPFPLYQCTECKTVFSTKQKALTHGLSLHLNLFYEKEEKEGEPPQGSFTCVARCTLSGELLGPPNYHTFNEKLLELHRSRFADMPLDQYRKKIINETDPVLIEKWKKEAAHKVIYRTKLLSEPVVFERSSLVEQHFKENYASGLVREGFHFIIPGTISQKMDDHDVRKMIQEAWQKEKHFPINMAIAIQQRFRRLGLHIFRTPAKMTFVSSVRPYAIDPAQTTEIVRNILEWIKTNTGKTRQDLVTVLAPGMSSDSAKVAEIINSLVWLIDRGHVIEFINGRLSVPNHMHAFNRKSRSKSSSSGQKSSDTQTALDQKPELKPKTADKPLN